VDRGDRVQGAKIIRVQDCAQEDLALAPALPWKPNEMLPPLAAPSPYAAAFDRAWSISSYSALVRGAAGNGSDASTTRIGFEVSLNAADEADDWRVGAILRRDEPVLPESPGRLTPANAADSPWHRFPRGAFAGNFLHGMLEWLAGEQFALSDNAALRQALARRCEREGWGHRADDVLRWLTAVSSTSLPVLGAPLQALTTRLGEMEFWLPSDGLKTGFLDQLCRQHVFPGLPRPQLVDRLLHGLLMGFADLVIEHQGQFWVLDYKSNALGTADADYTESAMSEAVLEHRYDVQAALYLLALHRLLRARLGARYVPERQLGGAIVFFLRGVASPHAGCLAVQPPLALLHRLEQDFFAANLTATGDKQ
jgi:exodeoxyribonuclease V beta subunit